MSCMGLHLDLTGMLVFFKTVFNQIVCLRPEADIQEKNKVKRIFTTEDTKDTEVFIVNRAVGALNNNKVFLCALCVLCGE